MKKVFILFSIILTGMLFYSCSTDFNVVAPYKETMVIYGLLNPDASTKAQYIRISKAYLGEGNALIMAQERDSINYSNQLDVRLERIDINGIVTQTCVLQRVDTNLKDPGIFNSPYEVLFKTPTSFSPMLTNGSTYRLTVYNSQTGVTAKAETVVIDSITGDPISAPSSGMNFTTPLVRTFSFAGATNAYVYNMTIRFHYKEVNLSLNDTTLKYVNWDLGDQATGIGQPTISYGGIYLPDLYRIVGSSVAPADTNQIKRFVDTPPIEFVITAGTEDLNTYQQIVQPSDGIVQERPLFTNIENGIGLFTSRYMKSIFKNLNAVSIAAFDTSAFTSSIHFH